MAINANRRNKLDATLQATTALPAAGASNATASFDLGGPGPHIEGLAIRVDLPILSALVDTKLVTFELEHSTDDSTFTDVGDAMETGGETLTTTGQILCTIAGTETPGTAAAAVFTLPIPEFCNRYVRVSQTVEAAGGDNTGVSTTVSLVS